MVDLVMSILKIKVVKNIVFQYLLEMKTQMDRQVLEDVFIFYRIFFKKKTFQVWLLSLHHLNPVLHYGMKPPRNK